MTINYSIIYPYPIYNQGLINILDRHSDIHFNCIGTTSSAREALIRVSDWMADLMIIGIHQKGIEELKIIELIKKKSRKNMVLLIASQDQLDLVRRGLVKGADGFIYAYSDDVTFMEAIHALLKKQVYLPPGFRIHPVPLLPPDPNRANGRIAFPITAREKEVLKLICKGLNNKQISVSLFISDQTVAVHRKNLFRKLGVKNSISLIQLAIEKKMIS
ncbi:MAG: response regulator transcription factor [Saprospiraceae bacterium]|nr:response regulator transcription factor [Saprospiraceae bacterium]